MAQSDLLCEGIARVLVVTAHPDDAEFTCGGTVALWTDAGVEVTYLIATPGNSGGFDESIERDEMAVIRRREQTEAAAVLGVTDVRFLEYTDGSVYPSMELRRDIARAIRQVRPDRVVTWWPENNPRRISASHPDHRAVGQCALDAVWPDARNPFAHPDLLKVEHLRPHAPASTWLVGAPRPEHAVDITAVFDRKLTALRCHGSQFPDPDALEPRLRISHAANASELGLPEGRLAETFLHLDTA